MVLSFRDEMLGCFVRLFRQGFVRLQEEGTIIDFLKHFPEFSSLLDVEKTTLAQSVQNYWLFIHIPLLPLMLLPFAVFRM